MEPLEPMEKAAENKYTILSVEKACDLLLLFGRSDRELGVSEIARTLGIGKSTVWKLLNTFENKGFLQKNHLTEKYALTVSFYEIACRYYNQVSVNSVVRRYMEMLSRKYGETIHYSVMDNHEIVYIERITGTLSSTATIAIGKRAPMYATGDGKAILAAMDRVAILNYMNYVRLIPYTAHTITQKELLMEDLTKTAERGYAYDDEEFRENTKCVAVAIKNYAGQIVGALSISAVASHLNDQLIEEMVTDLKLYAAEITRSIGLATNS